MKNVIEISLLFKGFVVFLVILSICILLDICTAKYKSAGLYKVDFQKSKIDQRIAFFHFSR